jgi:S1-C subfamily serine protease
MENKDSKNNFSHPAVIVTILILVFIGGYFLLNKNSATPQDNIPNPQQAEIDALKKTVEDLKNQKPQTVIKEVPAKSTSITDIVSEWGPVIPIVVCNFRDSNGILVESYEGSATLFESKSGKFLVVTNKHLVNNSIGNFANDCQIQFPNDSQIFTALTSDISTAYTNGADGALIRINNPDNNLKELISNSKKRFCSSMPNVGDQIVVLGYPAIGASSGVTATEGIISGYDGDYYVTSAKVDHGNSGGAAIDVKNNCDLGIPTYVTSGQLESLARILKWKAIVPPADQQDVANDKL